MHVLRVRVAGFGPLEGLELELAPGLNVVYGRNESGKTTLLDYLVAHLFRWEQRTGTRLETVLGDLDRFGDVAAAAGRVELRMGGTLHSYPGEGPSLLHHLGLEHAGLAGLFCVRSGELELPEKEPGDFWRELKKVLSGLPEGVETLRRTAHEAAGLTPTGRLSDRGDPGLRTERGELEGRIAALSELAGRLDRVAETAGAIAGLERRRERLEAARRARVASLHDRLLRAREELEAMAEVPDGTVERWRDLRKERERLRRRVDRAEEAVEEAAGRAREAREARDEAETAAGELRARLDGVEAAELEARARRLETDGGGPLRLAGPAYWTGLALLALGLGGAFLTPTGTLWNSTLIVVLGLLILAGLALYGAGRRLRARRREREAERRAVLEDAAGHGLEAQAPGEVPGAVRRLESRTHRAERERDVVRERAAAAEERLEERRREVEAAGTALKETGASLREVREATGLEELAEAEEARRRREEVRDRIRELEASLQELAGPDEEAWDVEPVPAEEREEAPSWSAAEKRRVDRELERLREEHRELRRDFDRAGLREPEQVLVELREAEERLREIERDRTAGRLAGEIFATMGEALDERLAAALAREGPHSVNRLVRRVTGSYVRVERREDALTIHDEAGRSWPLPHLSRGTRDQVYLAVRVGLARAALEAAELDEPGFFLLDDAFLTADWERRERLVETAADLAEEGWQVIYLTCDDHLLELFEGAGGRVHRL